ncbi:DUF4115 domain-containing protein [Streptomonospora sp. PA3]|uniref:RodZ domain-containing protein n=1 Tax=Streptomonospora sp. PA3 TaxID=2607326 RepID=UPI0012DD7310|nr:RodZ domain-containing protein [Streptomonospora sp. PA3]MUL40138.1 DUF4115 domain-containing protein [Streptomonospora sp. PA3]
MTTIGRTIAAARESAGYTLAELSARTCIRRPVLAGIEADDFRGCGGDFYARGHIRSVCRELGIDPAELIELYDSEHARERTVPAFTDKPITERDGESGSAAGAPQPPPHTGAGGRADSGAEEAVSAAGARGRPEAAAGRPRAPHGDAGAPQAAAAPRPPAPDDDTRDRQPWSGPPAPRSEPAPPPTSPAAPPPDSAAHGAVPSPRGRHGRRDDADGGRGGARTRAEGAERETGAAGAPSTGRAPTRRRRRRGSLLAATIAAARRSWPLAVFALLAGAAVVAALLAWPDGRTEQRAGAGPIVRSEEPSADAAPAPEEDGPSGQAEQPGRAQESQPAAAAPPSQQPGQAQESQQPEGSPSPRKTAERGENLSGMLTGERKAEQVHLTVSATERVWLRVTDAEGDNRFTGVLRKGELRAWTHRDELRLHVAKASAVRISVNGEHRGTPDDVARVAHFTFSATDLV